jgi:hypothetical protein
MKEHHTKKKTKKELTDIAVKAWETRKKNLAQKKKEQDAQPKTEAKSATPTSDSPKEQKGDDLDLGEYKFKVSVIQPPIDKPIHYDVDKNLGFVERMINNNKSCVFLFQGEAGTGKTNCINFLQWKYKKPIVRVNVTVNTEAQELKGKYLIQPTQDNKIVTEWMDGLITTALRSKAWLQIEEVNFMRKEHQSIFYSLFDTRKELILEQKGGERVSNPELVAFLTMNPLTQLGLGLIPALNSRIDAIFEFSYLTISKQKELLTKRYNFPEERAEQVSKIFHLVRKRYENIHLSSREAENWVKLMKNNGGFITDKKEVLRAFYHTVALKVTDDEIIRKGLMSVAEAIITGKVIDDLDIKEDEKEDDDDA